MKCLYQNTELRIHKALSARLDRALGSTSNPNYSVDSMILWNSDTDKRETDIGDISCFNIISWRCPRKPEDPQIHAWHMQING